MEVRGLGVAGSCVQVACELHHTNDSGLDRRPNCGAPLEPYIQGECKHAQTFVQAIDIPVEYVQPLRDSAYFSVVGHELVANLEGFDVTHNITHVSKQTDIDGRDVTDQLK
jgi:hypothetical protein